VSTSFLSIRVPPQRKWLLLVILQQQRHRRGNRGRQGHYRSTLEINPWTPASANSTQTNRNPSANSQSSYVRKAVSLGDEAVR
jgi:hypothetical protein